MKRTMILVMMMAAACLSFAQEKEPVNPENEKRTLELMKGDDPMRYRDMCELRDKHPHLYRRFMADETRKRRFMSKMRRRDPEVWKKFEDIRELGRKSRKLAEQYKQTSDQKKKAELKVELKTLLNQLFELREEKHKFHLGELEKEIVSLKKMIQERKANKEKIITRRLESLISEEPLLDW
ncbi:MAG: hypothetical protein KJ967_01470 [Elusimicrobia bacterium]|nr:hypothetical protein [Elusimicrobiota bacterium]